MNTTFLDEKISFGSLSVPRFMSAPMDGITDSPFRQMIRLFSNDELLFGEMRHIANVAHDPKKKSLQYNPIEQPLAFQFSGNKIDFLEKAIERVINAGFVMINLNAGCPAPGVIKSGSGSALMANKPILEQLIKELLTAINGRVSFTLKMRAGFKEKNALEIALMAQDLGVAGLIIHPRTQPGRFSSELDFELVKKIKDAVTIPVVFSGNLIDAESVTKTYEQTGVDGFMIGRALYGAPWKIHEIRSHLLGKPFALTPHEMLTYGYKHFELSLAMYGPHGFTIFKKHIINYITGIPNASQWRTQFLRTKTEDEMREFFDKLLQEIV